MGYFLGCVFWTVAILFSKSKRQEQLAVPSIQEDKVHFFFGAAIDALVGNKPIHRGWNREYLLVIQTRRFVLKDRNICIKRENGTSSPMTKLNNRMCYRGHYIINSEWWVKVIGKKCLCVLGYIAGEEVRVRYPKLRLLLTLTECSLVLIGKTKVYDHLLFMLRSEMFEGPVEERTRMNKRLIEIILEIEPSYKGCFHPLVSEFSYNTIGAAKEYFIWELDKLEEAKEDVLLELLSFLVKDMRENYSQIFNLSHLKHLHEFTRRCSDCGNLVIMGNGVYCKKNVPCSRMYEDNYVDRDVV